MDNPRPMLAWETLLDLSDPADQALPLRDRLERALRAAIAEGRLAPGAALPPSRVLSDTLGVSRWVVTEAYGQLVAEGILDARTASGTRVATASGAHDDGNERPSPPSQITRPHDAAAPAPGAGHAPRVRFDLRPGVPDLRATPRGRWSAALRTALTVVPDRDLATRHPRGYPPARRAVADYLSRSRRVHAGADEIRITHGATDAMASIARELRAVGHRHLLVEDPSWPRLREVAAAAGLTPVPIHVDEGGVDVGALVEASARTGARAALVTPAHQFPLGVALAPERRERLIRWARSHDAVLIEDDYDAEFRYDRRPIAALQAMAPERTVLIGSLSKTVSPAFGLGWAVVPPGFRGGWEDSRPSLVDQAALAEFITNGDLDRHLRRSRSRLRRRREELLRTLTARLPECPITGMAAGMHVVLTLPDGAAADDVTRAGALLDLGLVPLGRYEQRESHGGALVLGYGNLDDALVEEAVARLATAVTGMARTPATDRR